MIDERTIGHRRVDTPERGGTRDVDDVEYVEGTDGSASRERRALGSEVVEGRNSSGAYGSVYGSSGEVEFR